MLELGAPVKPARVGNERVLQKRGSAHSGPESCAVRAKWKDGARSVDRGTGRLGIEPRNEAKFREPTWSSNTEGNSAAVDIARQHDPARSETPSMPGNSCAGTGRPFVCRSFARAYAVACHKAKVRLFAVRGGEDVLPHVFVADFHARCEGLNRY